MKSFCALFFLVIFQNISSQNFDKLTNLKIYESLSYDEFIIDRGKVISSSNLSHFKDSLNPELTNQTNYKYNNHGKISHIEFKEFNIYQNTKYDASFHYKKDKINLIKLYYSHRENEESYYRMDIDYNKNSIIVNISEYPDTTSRREIKFQIELNHKKQIKQIKKTYSSKHSNYDTENVWIQIWNFEYKLGNIKTQERINYRFSEGSNNVTFSYDQSNYEYDKNKNVLNHLFNNNKIEILLYNVLFDELTSFNVFGYNLNSYNLNLERYPYYLSQNNIVKHHYNNSFRKGLNDYLDEEDLALISNLSTKQLINYNTNYNKDKSVESKEVSVENFNSTSDWPEDLGSSNNIIRYKYEYKN